MISVTVLGILAGIFSGMIPAAGNLTTLLVLMPFLYNLSVEQLLLFYIVMSSVSQYVTAVPSILLSVPGEASSIYTAQESSELTFAERKQVLRDSTIYSFIFTGITVLLLWAGVGFLDQHLANFFNSKTIFFILLLTFILTILFSRQNLLISVLLLCVGFAMSFVGYSFFFDTNITAGLDFLTGGIDPILVTILFVSIPEIFKPIRMTPTEVRNDPTKNNGNFVNSTVSTVIGFIGGLVPGLTTVSSASLYYNFGKMLNLSRNKLIIGIENANNAGSISQILPLLFFGIPILVSEALLLSLMISKGFSISTFSVLEFFNSSAVFFIAANFIALLFCLIFVKLPSPAVDLNFFKKITGVLVVVSLGIYIIFENPSGVYQLLLLAPVAYVCRHLNTVPMVMGFLMSSLFFESMTRVFIF